MDPITTRLKTHVQFYHFRLITQTIDFRIRHSPSFHRFEMDIESTVATHPTIHTTSPRHSAVSSFDTLERTWTWTSQIFRPTIHKFHRDKNRKDGVPLQTNCRINAVSRRVAGKVSFWTCPNSLRNKSWNFEVDEICVCVCVCIYL